jgi:hypothetical protein
MREPKLQSQRRERDVLASRMSPGSMPFHATDRPDERDDRERVTSPPKFASG